MKLSDFVIDFLARQNIRHIFGLTGGAVVHFFDSADKIDGIEPIFCHHEQACALAAVTYARITKGIGAAIITTGPGCTNAITGVVSAWQDSIPCIFISGQSRYEHVSYGTKLRQLGAQELNIIPIVESITKYSALINDPNSIKYHLEKAVYTATHGRPGPVWLDIPVNFHWQNIDENKIPGYTLPESEIQMQHIDLDEEISQICDMLNSAKKPLFMAGYGIRLAHGEEEFKHLINTLQIPLISSWTASDITPDDHPLNLGRMGMTGQRGANIAVQNCDLLICIGSHLSIPLTGTMFHTFAKNAKVVVVDIDDNEFNHETVKIDLAVKSDANKFLECLNQQVQLSNIKIPDIRNWREKCSQYKSLNGILPEWKKDSNYVNPYVFMDTLSEKSEEGEVIVVDGGGTNLYMSFQGFKVKNKQRLTLSSGLCAMGTGLPESIGACFANDLQRTICLIGDGSFQFNVQELQTIVHHHLPIKIFVSNNQGYLAIRHTQSIFLEKHFIGSSDSGGVSLPDVRKVAESYGLRTAVIEKNSQLEEKIQWAMNQAGPVLCEVIISPDQKLIPQQGWDRRDDGTFSPRPLDDMFPFLDRKKFNDMKDHH